MGIFDKAKAAAEQAAAKAKEGVDDVQTKREIGQTYGELGKATYELIQLGEVTNPRLDPFAEKLTALLAKDGDESGSTPVPVGVAHDPEQPPAMPT